MPSYSELVRSDMRLGWRRLRKAPAFAAATVFTLALGLGANTAMFSVVYGVLLKPLPFEEPERLVSVRSTAPGIGLDRMVLSAAQYFTYRDENRAFEDLAMWVERGAALTGVGDPAQVEVLRVTDGFLPVLRVQPLLGRRFTREDDEPGSPARVMLTHGCWQRRFGGDPSILDRRLTLDGVSREIIGVLPWTFRFLDTAPEMLVPLALDRATTRIGDFSFVGLARLRCGVPVHEANRDVARMIPLVPERFAAMQGLSASWYPEARLGPDVRLLSEDATGNVGRVLWVLTGGVGIVLLVACANAANLLLIRTEARRREMAVCAALGAGRGRLIRALLSGSVVLGLAGGATGLALAAAAVRVVTTMAPATLPRAGEIRLDGIAVVFAALLAVAAGLLFGLVPVIRSASPRFLVLSDGGRTASESRAQRRTRDALVVSEIALALVLLISSVLMMRTFRALRHVDPGFANGETVLTASLWISPEQAADGEAGRPSCITRDWSSPSWRCGCWDRVS
jgi:predicted permease